MKELQRSYIQLTFTKNRKRKISKEPMSTLPNFSLPFALLFILAVACTQTKPPGAEEILTRSISAHGMDKLDSIAIKFRFRDKIYTLERNTDGYFYTRSFQDSAGQITDSLVNSTDFSRFLNNQPVFVPVRWEKKYANSVNSVLYFFQIPWILQDPAAQVTYVDQITIKNEPYYTLKVEFSKEGGGVDYDDEFRYWVHANNYTVDYLAYNYHTEEGGTRFRVAVDRKRIEGILFQDYINYAPVEKFPPLDSLPSLYQKNQLEEVSRIINENIRIIE